MKNYEIDINDEGEIEINGEVINSKIFNEELVDYSVVDREDRIEYLCMWITESDKSNDKRLMLEDLKYLMKLEDEFVFSSIFTNEYIAKSDDEETFNNICEEIIKLNSEIKKWNMNALYANVN